MNKRKRRSAAGIFMMVLLLTVMWANQVYAATEVVYPPKNMLNVTVTDESGKVLPGVQVKLYNSSEAEVFSWRTNYRDSYDIKKGDITTTPEIKVPVSELSKYVPGEPLLVKKEDSYIYYDYWTCDGNEQNLVVEYKYEPKVVAGSEYIVPANTLVTVADESYAARTKAVAVDIDGVKWIDFDGKSGIDTYTIPAGTYKDTNTYFGSLYGGYCPDITVSGEAKEYVKIKLKMEELSKRFSNEGNFVKNGITYNVGEETPKKGAFLLIMSGSIITAAVPDAEGYVEFYVDKATKSYRYWSNCWADGSAGGGPSGTSLYEATSQIKILGVDKPQTGINIYNVPSGQYTMRVTSVPEGYDIPKEQTFTIRDSNVFDYKSIVVKKEHIHSYGTEYEKDEANHWNECACGAKTQVAAHIPGAAATQTSPCRCTVCGYVITPELGHVHSYSDTYESNARQHWKGCSCGQRIEVADHSLEWIVTREQTEQQAGLKHQECSVCGYKTDSVEIPQLQQEQSTEETSEAVTEADTQEETTQAATEADTQEESTQATDTGAEPVDEGGNCCIWCWIIILLIIILVIGILIYIYKKYKKKNNK